MYKKASTIKFIVEAKPSKFLIALTYTTNITQIRGEK